MTAGGQPHVVVGGTAGPVPEACRDLLPVPPEGGPVAGARDEVVAGVAGAGVARREGITTEVGGPRGGRA